MRTALFWGITQRVVVISYRRFGTTYQSHPQGQKSKKKKNKMGPICCPETSVRNCHYSLRNAPEERSSQLLYYVIWYRTIWYVSTDISAKAEASLFMKMSKLSHHDPFYCVRNVKLHGVTFRKSWIQQDSAVHRNCYVVLHETSIRS